MSCDSGEKVLSSSDVKQHLMNNHGAHKSDTDHKMCLSMNAEQKPLDIREQKKSEYCSFSSWPRMLNKEVEVICAEKHVSVEHFSDKTENMQQQLLRNNQLKNVSDQCQKRKVHVESAPLNEAPKFDTKVQNTSTECLLINITETDVWFCRLCKISFGSQSIDHHIKSFHGGINVIHVCCDCGSQFNRSSNLKNHVSTVHKVTCVDSVNKRKPALCTVFVNTSKDTKLTSSTVQEISEATSKISEPQTKNTDVNYISLKNGSEKQVKSVSVSYQKYSCMECSDSFNEHEQLKMHLQETHKISHPETILRKPAAGDSGEKSKDDRNKNVDETMPKLKMKEIFKSWEGLREYAKRLYEEGKLQLDNSIKNIYQDITQEQVLCTICKQTFKSRKYLKKHVLHVHKGQKRTPELCEICGKEYAFLSDHIKSMHHNIKRPKRAYDNILCDICGKQYKRKSQLQHHMYSHLPKRSLPCEKCGKMYKTPHSLRTHIRMMHEGTLHRKFIQKLIPCTKCKLSFACEAKLKSHMRCHTGETPHRCNFCNAAFKWEQSLTVHMRRHNDEYPYECDICHKKFRWVRSYTVHMASPNVHRNILHQRGKESRKPLQKQTQDTHSSDQATQTNSNTCKIKTENVTEVQGN